MSTRGERLRQARKAAGFDAGSQAAKALGVPTATYSAHERAEQPGGRDYGPAEAARYGRRFRVEDTWLLTGKGRGPSPRGESAAPPPDQDHVESSAVLTDDDHSHRQVLIVGYAGAGAVAHFYAYGQGSFDTVNAPEWANENTKALEIRGNSLGELFDRWIIFYDEVRSPITPDMLGKLCVVGLSNDQILVKKVMPGKNGHYRLLSNNEKPIEDAEIVWAARVKSMEPR